jgi:peptidoglycan hydrolase-like protein with peptidoglycan-binding domain
MNIFNKNKVTVAVLSITMFAAPVMTLAQTATISTTTAVVATTTPNVIANLQAQIASLLLQIQTLKQQMQQPRPGTTAPSMQQVGTSTPFYNCPAVSRDLSEGSRGDDVMELQKFLVAQDTALASSSITGIFGPRTVRAVKLFQERNEISSTSTGFVGPKTREFLKGRCELKKKSEMIDSGNTMTSVGSTTMRVGDEVRKKREIKLDDMKGVNLRIHDEGTNPVVNTSGNTSSQQVIEMNKATTQPGKTMQRVEGF